MTETSETPQTLGFDHSTDINLLAEALVKAQGEIKAVKKAGFNPHFKSQYADLSDVLDAVSVPLSSNGLALVQFPISNDVGAGVESVVLHTSGQWVSQRCILPAGKKDAQGFAGCIKYCRRYSITAMFRIAEADDDGNSAVERAQPRKAKKDDGTEDPTPTIKDLRAEVKRIGGDVESRLLTRAGKASLDELTTEQIGKLVPWLKTIQPNGGA